MPGPHPPDTAPGAPRGGLPDRVPRGGPEVLEPEIVEGFDPGAPDGSRRGGPPAQVGCTLGPGCGCLAVPIAALGALLATSVFAVAWLLRIGQTAGAVGGMLDRILGRGRRPPGGPPPR